MQSSTKGEPPHASNIGNACSTKTASDKDEEGLSERNEKA
jgi:hypothetical protein